MPTANFTLPPNELIAQLQAQALRQKEAEDDWSLARRPAPPAQLMDTGAYKIPDFATPLIQAMTRAKMEEQVKAERARSLDLSGKYQQQMAAAMQAYLSGKRPSSVELPGPTEDGEPLKGTVQPNLNQVDEQALTSPFPEVQKMAQENIKRRDTHFGELLKKASVASGVDALQAGGDFGKLRAKDDWMPLDGTIFSKPEHGTPTMIPGGGYTVRRLPDGQAENINNLTGRVSGEGGVRQTVNIPDKKYPETIVEGQSKLRDNAEKLARSLSSTALAQSQLNELLDRGGTTGTGSELIQSAATLVTKLTGLTFDTTPAIGTLIATLSKAVYDELGTLGSQVSNTDLLFIKGAMGGAQTDAKALERLLAIRLGAQQQQLEKYNRDVVDSAMLFKEPGIGEHFVRRNLVQQPSFRFLPRSPEAAASYLAARRRISFEEALDEARKDFAPNAQAPTPTPGRSSLTPEERAAKLRALGIPGY